MGQNVPKHSITLCVLITANSQCSLLNHVFSLHLHTAYLCMKLNIWIQCGYCWHRGECAINKNLGKVDLHCSFLPEISILLLIVEFQTASRSAVCFCSSSLSLCSSNSISPNELAPCCLTLWTPPACLHLWMTDVLFYTLLRLSLTHTPTYVTAYAARVRSLPFTCSLFISLPSFSWWSRALKDNCYTCMRSHIICIAI